MIGLPDLQWFPKPFGAGDTDGEGSKKMLGQPEVNPASLLVREMAQNSWDARLDGVVPRFEMRFRSLDENVRDVLRWNVFGGRWSENLGLERAINSTDLCAVEVLDRGTKGLGGPTRNDIDPAAGEPADFADFVLTIGAPPEHGHGGGTYGFGKTAAYLASECSTIVIWSRFRHADGSFEERFIASAMGSRFVVDGQRYTGRQWWGFSADAPDTQAVFRVEPAVGDDARTLGQAVFERRFADDETGTSILILQPKGREDVDELVDNWTQAVTRNLWPKLDTDQPMDRRMDIGIARDGVDLPLPGLTGSAALEAAARCLTSLRQVGTGTSEAHPLVQVQEIWCHRPRQLLGHIALTKYLAGADDGDGYAADSLIFMRNRAELVVRDEMLGPTADGLTRWVGVFKPLKELDSVFAAAEPPAHDSWNPGGLEDPRHRTFVKLALERSRESANIFRGPAKSDVVAKEASSTGQLAVALAGLVGSSSGPIATNRPKASGPRGKARSHQPRVEVLEILPIPQSSDDWRHDRQTTRVALEVTGSKSAVPVHAASLSLAVDGGVMASEGQVVLKQWTFEGGASVSADVIELPPGQKVFADISFPAGLAIDFKFAAGEA